MGSSSDVLPRVMSLAVHELRTPVTVVGGYLRMLLREQAGPLTEKQKKMLEEAERSCGRIGTVVNEMSDFGKLDCGDLKMAQQEIDVAGLLAELAVDMHEGEDRGVRLDVRGTEKPMVVSGDRTRLSAALRALLQSALRERGEPGSIIAECSQMADGAGTRYVVIAIGDDTALPILTASGADQPAFDVWRHGGLGLALPVARQVIEGHGGKLWSAHGAHSRAAAALRLPLRT